MEDKTKKLEEIQRKIENLIKEKDAIQAETDKLTENLCEAEQLKNQHDEARNLIIKKWVCLDEQLEHAKEEMKNRESIASLTTTDPPQYTSLQVSYQLKIFWLINFEVKLLLECEGVPEAAVKMWRHLNFLELNWGN